jgi:serine/threonine-protein kinase RsbW/stage II sporulation protein AB (anti-sigma F factor)
VLLELPAVPNSVSEARHAVSDLAERYECDQGAIRIAVSEAVGNCALHAYRDGASAAPGPVLVLARVLEGRFVVTIVDCGGGLRPRVDSPGLGLGLPIISRLAEDVRIESDDEGTAMSVSFPIGEGVTSRSHGSPIHSSARTAAIDAELARARGMLRRFGGRGFGRRRAAVAF